jgi:hypothetical protein
MMILHREFSIEVLELIVSHAPPAVTNGDLSIRPKVGRDFVFGIFLLGPQAIQGQKLHGISNANSQNDSCISPATQASEIISHGFGKSLARRSLLMRRRCATGVSLSVEANIKSGNWIVGQMKSSRRL